MKNTYNVTFTMKERISKLEEGLAKGNAYTGEELASMGEELFQLHHIRELWQQLGDIPLEYNSDNIDVEWHHFPKGTNRFDIWHWFEDTFNISVAIDLMGFED